MEILKGITPALKYLANRIAVYTLMIAACMILSSAQFIYASSIHDSHLRAIVVVTDYLSLDDLQSCGESTKGIITNSAIGLVNTGMNEDLPIRYLSLACGGRPYCRKSISPEFYEPFETVHGVPAINAFKYNTGVTPPHGSAICVNIAELHKEYGVPRSLNPVRIGVIGDSLKNARLRSVVIGNADIPGQSVRYTPLILSNSQGYAEEGIIATECISKPQLGFCGIEDDVDKIVSNVMRYAPNHALILAHFGDLARLELYKQKLSDQAYRRYRRGCLSKLDMMLGRLRNVADEYNASLLIISSSRNRQNGEEYSNLAPIVIYRARERQGTLTSYTTRTKGLISNIDVAPTLLNLLEIDVPPGISGRAAYKISDTDVVKDLLNMENLIVAKYAIRVPVLVIIGAIAMIVISACVYAIRNPSVSNASRKWLEWLAMLVLAVPAGLQISDWVNVQSLITCLLSIVIGIGFVLAASYTISTIIVLNERKSDWHPVFSLLLITTVLITIGLLVSPYIQSYSILGYNYIECIRCYGIGNEYMGFLIGMSIVPPIVIYGKLRTYQPDERVHRIGNISMMFIVIWYAFLAFIIGFPGIGANAGGFITAVVSFGMVIAVLLGKKLNYIDVILAVLAAIGGLFIFTIYDLLHSEAASHIGRSFSMARSTGFGSLLNIISRKLLMHSRILTSPQFVYPAICSVPIIYMLFGSDKGRLHRHISWEKPDFIVIMMASCTAFLFNDSGIVPAIFIIGVYFMTRIILKLGETS